MRETELDEKEGARLHAFNCLLWASLQMSPAVPLHGGFQSVEHRLRPHPRPPFKCQSDRRCRRGAREEDGSGVWGWGVWEERVGWLLWNSKRRGGGGGATDWAPVTVLRTVPAICH